jgi:hypothetical protein
MILLTGFDNLTWLFLYIFFINFFLISSFYILILKIWHSLIFLVIMSSRWFFFVFLKHNDNALALFFYATKKLVWLMMKRGPSI